MHLDAFAIQGKFRKVSDQQRFVFMKHEHGSWPARKRAEAIKARISSERTMVQERMIIVCIQLGTGEENLRKIS